MSTKIYSSRIATEIAADLLKIGAIKLNPKIPFTWTSGWKSPIYCDNRLSLSYPEIRSKIKTALELLISQSFGNVDAVAAVATAGIPQGAMVADKLKLPFLYVRPAKKEHGLKNSIEGKVDKGQKLVIVEDLISTGGSVATAIEALQQANAEIAGIAAIFTYGFPMAEEKMKKYQAKLVVLSDYNHLLNYAQSHQMFDHKILETLKKWRISPAQWG